MSGASELQKAIYDALVADASVGALAGGRIYDGPPSDLTFPYVSFGPVQQLDDDTDCITSEAHAVQIDCWSRDQGRLRPCKDLVAAVRAALHRASLSLSDPYALEFIRVAQVRVFIDNDGITAHGVVSVEAAVETV